METKTQTINGKEYAVFSDDDFIEPCMNCVLFDTDACRGSDAANCEIDNIIFKEIEQ